MIKKGQTLILRTDGASRGNPGHAAAGVVIEDTEGKLLARGKKYLGKLTNNQAEYSALILGLRSVARYEPGAVTIYMDSELIVNQMNGRYQVKNVDMKPLYEEAKGLVASLASVSFTHVPRAENHLADALANEALDAQRQSAPPPARQRMHS
jgi:ribonuclease HI